MRTYNAEKRYGASSRDKTFLSDAEQKRFDFFEFLLSKDIKVAEPKWFAEYMESMKYKDGSYAVYPGTVVGISAQDIHGTCRAVCVMKPLGIEPPKGALEYIERRKKDDGSFRLLADSDLSNIYTTYDAALALKLGGRAVPKDSVDYAKRCRNDNGGYGWNSDYDGGGTLSWTRQALTILKAAGTELSSIEKAQTGDYILSELRGDGFGNVEFCYDALVSLDLINSRPGADEKGMILEQLENKTPNSNYEEGFKLLVIRKLLGQRNDADTGLKSQGAAPQKMWMSEAYYAVWLAKLEAYGR